MFVMEKLEDMYYMTSLIFPVFALDLTENAFVNFKKDVFFTTLSSSPCMSHLQVTSMFLFVYV